MIKKLKKLTLIDWMVIIIVTMLPLLLTLVKFVGLDNDLWYLLTEGRYIIQNGIYHVDTLSMHTGLDIVVQNWLSAVIFWIVFAFLKSYGVFFMVFVANIAICYLLYKISILGFLPIL